MARIQTPQHGQELQAEFKIRETFGLELIETIQPTYQLGLQKVASEGYPRKAFGSDNAAAGGVGTNVECALRCPADIGIIILLETISITGPTAGSTLATMRADDGAAMTPIVAAATTKQFRDTRINPAILPSGVLETANPLTAAPNGTHVGIITVLPDTTIVVKVDVVLGGGGYFLVRNGAVNAALDCDFTWTEFLLEDR